MTLPIQHVPDHAQKIRDLLPFWFRTKPVIEALFLSMGESLQQLEDDVYDAYFSEQFSVASGLQLDEWGLLFGVAREGLDDRYYRNLINATAIARRFDGNRDSLIQTYQAATAPSTVELSPILKPKGLVLTAFRVSYLPRHYSRRVGDLMRGISPTKAIVLLEAQSSYLGFSGRTRTPFTAPLGSGIPARVL
jgi:hypothetical protein